MMSYEGFDVHQMLNTINLECERVSLVKEGKESWCLTFDNRDLGKQAFHGSLFYIVLQAFKPFAQDAKARKARHQKEFDRIIAMTHKES